MSPLRAAAGLVLALGVALVGCRGESERAAGVPRIETAPDDVRLVLLLVVDQLRRDRFSADLPGGLGRLAREGRIYTEAVLAHAQTETCPGHVSLVTGVHPGRAGVAGNYFVDRESGERVYCVADRSGKSTTFGGRQARSPALIRVTALGDWLKAANPDARVVSLSPKDRAAIALGGQHPDHVYWLEREQSFGFTTSRFYADALPEWIVAWNGDAARTGFPARAPTEWVHEPVPGARTDDFPGEDERFSRTSPHPIADVERGKAVKRLFHSPYIDDATLDLALEWVERERLGQREAVDLLAISLSATDKLGHLYGPYSQEAAHALAHLDALVGRFLDSLDEAVGLDRMLVVLSADHGVAPLPEWQAHAGQATCGAEDARTYAPTLAARLDAEITAKIGKPGPWITLEGFRVTASRSHAHAAGVPLSRILAIAEEVLRETPGVREVWNARRLARAPADDEFAALYRNGRDGERAGDLEIQMDPGCLLWKESQGTNHGSPYLYDRAIPLALRGPAVEPGPSTGPARSIDVAPTLALILGVPTPEDLDGKPLPLRD